MPAATKGGDIKSAGRSGQASLRLFLALWPDARVRDALLEYARQWKKRGRWRLIPAERLHMTLVFIGEADAGRDLATIQQAAGRQCAEPFGLRLDRPGHFGGRNGTAWLGPSQPPSALLVLQNELRDALQAVDVQPDTRPYVPHVSLLRGSDQAAPPAPVIDWWVTEFVLVSSRQSAGSLRYEILQRWALSAA